MQKVIVIGATGLIGSHVVEALKEKYEVLGASRSTSPSVDMMEAPSVEGFLRAVGPFQHLVVAAGDAAFGPLKDLDEAKLMTGVRSKMLGQMLTALEALKKLPENGSVTLTSGVLAEDPMPGTAGVAFVNGAVNSFVRAAALELESGRRINAVSPGWIKETMEKMGMDPTPGMAASDVALLYKQAIEGNMNGEVVRG